MRSRKETSASSDARGGNGVRLAMLIAAGVTALLDQALKRILPDSGWVLPGVMEMVSGRNYGSATGLIREAPSWILAASALLLTGALAVFLPRFLHRKRQGIFLGLILGGGIGNLADRIALGYVVDYIRLLPVRFWVFNFADAAITVGAALLAVSLCRRTGVRS